MKPTLKQLLRWAKEKTEIRIYTDGSTAVFMGSNHEIFCSDTLYQALYKAWKAEKNGK